MKKGWKAFLISMLILLAAFSAVSMAEAATPRWVHTNGHYYYKNKKGKTVKKKIINIGKKSYFFDYEGIQRTGWRNFKGNYYYFNRKGGKKGYMLKNQTVDGVRLDEQGRADFDSSAEKRKITLIARCTRLVDEYTDEDMAMPTKKQLMFRLLRTQYGESAVPDYHTRENFDMDYAEYLLNRQTGDCYAYGALFAYIMKAIGYEDPMFVCSTGHGWTECKERIYDPEWAKQIGPDLTYNVPYWESGTLGRPDWVNNRDYIFHVNRDL